MDLPQSCESWLLDCGDLHPLGLRQLQQISTVFLSHAHIDHWIGLDALLRAQLFGSRPLRIFGPAGLHRFLTHRLGGYAWNLTSGSHFVIQGFELSGEDWLGRSFPCRAGFEPQSEPLPWPELSGWSLSWVELDHGVPCLGYRLQAPLRYRFDSRCPYPPGPWIERLKAGLDPQQLIEIGDQSYAAAHLAQWLQPLPVASLAYITDTRLGPTQRQRIVTTFAPTRQLWCESAFLESQRPLAEAKLHATTLEAAQLAQELGAERLNLFHLSRRCQGLYEEHLSEARSLFPESYVDREVYL